jgi:hypothetical protein
MKRFVQGDNRTQTILLPEALDDYITDTNLVRVVDVFVDELDLQQLGFEGVEPALTGRPAYHPEVMLKIYYSRAAVRPARPAPTTTTSNLSVVEPSTIAPRGQKNSVVRFVFPLDLTSPDRWI